MSLTLAEERRHLERALEEDRARIQDALDDLESIARAKLDVGRRIAERPGPWLAAGALVGLALGWRRHAARGATAAMHWRVE